jgi:hypothetical protein
MAIVAGNTAYWTSAGITYSGTVLTTPTQLANGLPNQEGGEPMYTLNNQLPLVGSITAATVVTVRSVELRAAA